MTTRVRPYAATFGGAAMPAGTTIPRPTHGQHASAGAPGRFPSLDGRGLEAALREIMGAPGPMTTEEMNAALATMRGEK